MKKSFLTSLCALCTLFLISSAVKAGEYTIGKDASTHSYTALPIRLSGMYGAKYSLSQQIYLASELTAEGASEGDITAIRFYYSHESNTTVTRNIEVWIMETSLSQFSMTTDDPGKLICNSSYKAGTQVFDGSVTLQKDAYTIEFNKNGGKFPWGGSNNILLTVYDKTGEGAAQNRHVIMATDNPRFLHKVSTTTPLTSWNINDLYNTAADSYKSSSSEIVGHKWVNKITFTIDDGEDPEPPAVPTGLDVSAISINSATLSWSGSYDATSYDLQQSANGEDWSSLTTGLTGTSYNWTGLDPASTQYARIRANNAVGSSDWSEAVTVTTDAIHEHDGITFSKWASNNSLPTSGNYYLANNVAFGIMNDDVTLDGNLNLCLNGKIADVYGSRIIVPSGKTLTIYDNVGGGKITGVVASEVGLFEDQVNSLIVVKSGGSLVLKQGTIENAYIPDADGSSYAIYSNGTVRISGNVLINSNDADIYLNVSKVVTLDGAISNTQKHTVYKGDGAITSRWSTYMSAADPRDYFESANSGKSVCLSEGEAALRTLLHLSEESQNSGITTNYNQTVDVELTRSLTSAQYNTFCLPFALSAVQMAEFFGAGYDLEELTSSSLDEEGVLTLSFTQVTALEAGKPYLLQPSVNVVNPSFEGVAITVTSPLTVETSYADLKALYAPTELEGGNHNLLFLGEDNTLFWPENTGNMNAFRAYFVVKGAAANAVQARIGRAESQTTAIDNQKSHIDNHKYMKDGQLLIERNGIIYNAQGQTIK